MFEKVVNFRKINGDAHETKFVKPTCLVNNSQTLCRAYLRIGRVCLTRSKRILQIIHD